MAGRIASASIRAVVGQKKSIKAALTLVCTFHIFERIVQYYNTHIFFIFFQTPSAVNQLKKILSGKSEYVSLKYIFYIKSVYIF